MIYFFKIITKITTKFMIKTTTIHDLKNEYKRSSYIINKTNFRLIDLNSEDNHNLSRYERRDIKKRKNKINNNIKYKKYSEYNNITNNLILSLKKKKFYLESDEEFLLLSCFINSFYYILKNNVKTVSIDKTYSESLNLFKNTINNMMKEMISRSKLNGVSTKLLDFYNIDGTINEDKISNLNCELSNLYKSDILKCYYYNSDFTFEDMKNTFDIDGDLTNYQNEFYSNMKKEKDEERNKRIQINKEKRIKKETSDFKFKKVIIKRNELNKYITNEGLLRNNILDLITYDKFKALLEFNKNINNKAKDYYLNEYKKIYISYNLESIEKLLTEKEKIILERLSLCDNEETTCLYNEVLESIFNSRNISKYETRVKKVSCIINKYVVEEKSHDKNIIIFSSDNMFNENINKIFEINNKDYKLSALKNISHCLNLLRTQNLDDVKSRGKNVFHIMNQLGNYNIGSLKGYRFGPKKTKICLFKLSVCMENQNILKELYNLNTFPNVYLVFGFGNVAYENENDLYNRITDSAIKNREELIRISDLFAYPFTNETLEEVKKYIESSVDNKNKILSLH